MLRLCNTSFNASNYYTTEYYVLFNSILTLFCFVHFQHSFDIDNIGRSYARNKLTNGQDDLQVRCRSMESTRGVVSFLKRPHLPEAEKNCHKTPLPPPWSQLADDKRNKGRAYNIRSKDQEGHPTAKDTFGATNTPNSS